MSMYKLIVVVLLALRLDKWYQRADSNRHACEGNGF